MERGPLPFLLQELATWKANVQYLWILRRCSTFSVDKENSFIHFKIFRLKLPASFSSLKKSLHNFFPVADSPPLITGHLITAYFKWLQNFIYHQASFILKTVKSANQLEKRQQQQQKCKYFPLKCYRVTSSKRPKCLSTYKMSSPLMKGIKNFKSTSLIFSCSCHSSRIWRSERRVVF